MGRHLTSSACSWPCSQSQRAWGPRDFFWKATGMNATTNSTSQLEFLEKSDPAVALLDAGDGTLYDGRTLHCGGANRSNVRRTLLNITFCHASSPKGLDVQEAVK